MTAPTPTVLVVTSVFPRNSGDGTPPFVLNQCRDLAAAGCRITVLAPHSPGLPTSSKEDGCHVVRFRYMLPTSFQTLCYEGGMLIRLKQKRTRLLQLPFFALAQYRAILALLHRESPDIIHAHSLLPQGLLAALANAGSIPLVTSSHGSDVFQLNPRWSGLMRKAVRESAALVANSRATRDRLQQLGATPSRIHLIPATPNFSDPEKPLHRFPEKPVILYAGRLIREKGVDALIEALPRIRRNFPDCQLRLAGTGGDEELIRNRVAELQLQGYVHFLGWLGPVDLREEMASATLLATPSRVMEGQNLVVTEAMSVGCPVAVTPSGGMLDLVEDGRTGFIIPEPEAESIADSLIQLLGDTSRLAGAASHAFRHFQEHYSRESVSGRTLQLYRNLCYNSHE